MVKGINRRVIEIQMPKDSGFERALLYLSPTAARINSKKARAAITDICRKDEKYPSSRVALKITSVLLGLTTAAFAVLLILYLNSL